MVTNNIKEKMIKMESEKDIKRKEKLILVVLMGIKSH